MGRLTDNPLWRLAGGNPIFCRVVEAAAKRARHAVVRMVYLGVLVCVAAALTMSSLAAGGTLTELSLRSANLFKYISFLQLGMACLMAPIFTAGAITQEKDSQTYSVLLATPLSNAQIVLGSLLSRLFFVLVLLASGIPIFLITQLWGGVTGKSILLSFMIAAATAIFTGAAAVAIAVVRVGTGKTIFSFYIGIGLYLAAVWALGELPALAAPGGQTSTVTALHPFASLMVVLNMTRPPTPADLPSAGWPTRLWLCSPHYAYLCWTLSASAVMIVLGTIFVRRSHARTRLGVMRRIRLWLGGGRTTRRPRSVWANPVAWREAATRARAGGKSIVRWVFLILGLAGGLTLAIMTPTMAPVTARAVLRGVLWVEFTLILLVGCNVAAGAITREREDGTLDLLLVTPITSRYYLWGKLRGLISFSSVLLIVPIATAAMVAVAGLLGPAPVVTGRLGRMAVPIFTVEAVFAWGVQALTFCALTAMIALNMSLKVRGTINAVMITVAVVAAIALGGGALAMMGLNNLGGVGPVMASLSPYVMVSVFTSPHTVAADALRGTSMEAFRIQVCVLSILGAGGYALMVAILYHSMVKTFDMIIRKQSR